MKQLEFDAKCVELRKAQQQKFVSTQQSLSELAEKKAEEVLKLIQETQKSRRDILEDISRERQSMLYYAKGTDAYNKCSKLVDTCNLRLTELADYKNLEIRKIEMKYAKLKHSINLEYAAFKEECEIKKMDLINQKNNSND